MADESITKLRSYIVSLSLLQMILLLFVERIKNLLMIKHFFMKYYSSFLFLSQKLKTSYLTINTLNKDIVDRAEEMNKLRKECSQLRLEVSDNQQKMSAEAQVLTQSYAISPFEVQQLNQSLFYRLLHHLFEIPVKILLFMQPCGSIVK